jgi:hypothetical protein
VSYSPSQRRRDRRHSAARLTAQQQWWRAAERALRRWIAALEAPR